MIEGLVTDQSGAAVSGANVRVVGSNTGLRREISTDQTGRFRAMLLPLGGYRIEVEKAGFTALVENDLRVAIGQNVAVTLTLQVGARPESIAVNSDVDSRTLNPDQAARFGTELVNNLPTTNRDFADFVILSPNASLLESRYGSTLTIDGQKGIFSSFNIDGSDSNNPFYGERRGGLLAPFTMSLSSVDQFQVVTQGASAEYGRSTGAFVNIVTASGTNQHHGTAFLQFRDPALASDNEEAVKAKEVSDNPRQYQFGGNLGGPIKKDRLFYFLSFDQNTGRITKPNRIDPQLVSIFATRFNDPGEQGPIERTNDASAALGKLDWKLNEGNLLTLRHSFSLADLKNAAFDVPTWGRSSNGREHDRINASIAQLMSTFSPSLINELRVLYSREDRQRIYDGPNLADVTIGGVDALTGDATSFRFGSPFFLPGAAFDRRWDLNESISWTHGKHLIKAGFELNHVSILNPYLGQGRYIFASISAFQTYLNNYPSDLSGLLLFSQNVALGGRTLAQAQTQTLTQTEPEAYVQARFQPLPNLSIDYGIRYSAQLEPQPITPVSQRRYAQFIGKPGFPSDGSIPSETGGWQPRLGVAWRPTANSSTLIRANIGIYTANVNGLALFAARTSDGTISGTINSFSGSLPTPPPNLGFLNYNGSAIANPGVSVYDSHFRNPRSLQWSLSAERRVGELLLSVAFDYNNTNHILRIVNRNAPSFQGHYDADGRKLFDGSRPFSLADGSGIGDLSTTESSAHSLYRAFVFKVDRPLRNHVGFGVNYTLSWDYSDDDAEQDPFLIEYADITNFKPEYGYSDRDQRHRLNAYIYTILPGRFTASATFRARSAQPYTQLLSSDANLDGNLYDRPFLNGHDIGRNSARLDNQFYSLDLRVKREFSLERVRLEANLDVFNLTNSSNLRGLQDSLLFNFDGFIRSGFGTPRQAQVGMRIRF